jgi:hypothetical protein
MWMKMMSVRGSESSMTVPPPFCWIWWLHHCKYTSVPWLLEHMEWVAIVDRCSGLCWEFGSVVYNLGDTNPFLIGDLLNLKFLAKDQVLYSAMTGIIMPMYNFVSWMKSRVQRKHPFVNISQHFNVSVYSAHSFVSFRSVLFVLKRERHPSMAEESVEVSMSWEASRNWCGLWFHHNSEGSYADVIVLVGMHQHFMWFIRVRVRELFVVINACSTAEILVQKPTEWLKYII